MQTYYMHKFTSYILGQSFGKLTDWARVISRLTQAKQMMNKCQVSSCARRRLVTYLTVYLTVWMFDLRGKNVIAEKTKVEDVNEMKETTTHIINTLVYNSGKQEARSKWCFLSLSLSQLDCWSKRLRKRTSQFINCIASGRCRQGCRHSQTP